MKGLNLHSFLIDATTSKILIWLIILATVVTLHSCQGQPFPVPA